MCFVSAGCSFPHSIIFLIIFLVDKKSEKQLQQGPGERGNVQYLLFAPLLSLFPHKTRVVKYK